MKYVISQTLDEVNKILDEKLKEPTWKDEMEWEENDLLYDYNPAEVMATKKAKVAELTLEQQEIHNMVQEYSDIVYSDIKILIRSILLNILLNY